MIEPENSNSGWSLFKKELWRRASSPQKQPTYVFYFLVSMIAGAIGVWAAMTETWLGLTKDQSMLIILSSDGTFKSMVTFFAALGSASCARIVMVEDKEKHLRAFFTLFLFIIVGTAVVAFVVGYKEPANGMPFAIFGIVVAIVAWWIANWDDHVFQQDHDGEATSLGGSIDNDPAGDTEGFVV